MSEPNVAYESRLLKNVRYTSNLGLTRDEWVEQRKDYIGGSDVAAIMEASPWETPIDVYLSKLGLSEPKQQSVAMRMGNVLEPVIAKLYAEETGRKVERSNLTWRHPQYDFLRANVDRFILPEKGESGRGILECKSTSSMYKRTWGNDRIPIHYYYQIQHYLGVTGLNWAAVAMLFDGRELVIEEFQRNDDFIEETNQKLTAFWWDCVKGHNEPKCINSLDVLKLYPTHTRIMQTASEEVAEDIAILKDTKASIKKLEVEEAKLTESIKLALGEFEGFQDANEEPLLTWAATKDTQQLDKDAFKTKHPDLYNQFLITKPGSRRIRIF